jgi:hypothetical protein
MWWVWFVENTFYRIKTAYLGKQQKVCSVVRAWKSSEYAMRSDQFRLSSNSDTTIHVERVPSNVVASWVSCKEVNHTSNFRGLSKTLERNCFCDFCLPRSTAKKIKIRDNDSPHPPPSQKSSRQAK